MRQTLITLPPANFFTRVDHPCFARQFDEISFLLKDRPGLLSLFHLHLITALVQTPEPEFQNARRFLADHLDFTNLPGFELPLENREIWYSVPVILTSSGRAYIRYMILGKMSSPGFPDLMPAWALPLFDPAALEAVRTSARVARALCGKTGDERLVCYPLTQPAPAVPQHGSPRFQGTSLGLPLALGFAALLNGHPIPRTLAATGRITEQGEILAVGRLDLKKSGLENARFKALIHPSDGSGFSPAGPITCLPVSTLSQAYALFSLYSPESTRNLMLLSACLNDPKVLAKNIGALPCGWLEWITRHGLARPAIDALTSDPHLFAAYTDIFLQKTGAFDTDHAGAIQALVSKQAIQEHTRTAPLSVFKWCTASLALANHCGDIENAGLWETTGQSLCDIISGMDLDLVADFFNHALVARHNRYQFTPQLPEPLTRLLAFLESMYAPKCEFGCPTDPVLGRLYGTLMQHFAFCGPKYLDRTRSCFHKAVQALGRDRVIEFREEWRRQYNYLTYALLDAGDRPGASQSLVSYFDCARMDDLVDLIFTPDISFSPWQTALTARYFAGNTAHPARDRIFKHLLQRFQSDPGSAHPRQLTAFNLGRMALALEETSFGAALLEQSIELCFSPNAGPTIQVMALLPISFLPDSALPSLQQIHTWEQTICSAAARLDASHFSQVLDTPLMEIRSHIKQTPAAWFPFNYR
ncbi:hypothetical protein [Desulfotignum phosphitoxidans]|uniref:hypothetical protein n=1 Tax=Desulfotignum phosphitoxidans TaxID=190898 RepID=UPI0012687D8F|nr:hypothetical protein [Desulfotignum phosphitoxidans]